MSTGKLPYPLFDADNHLYETEESLTKYLPKAYKGAIQYVQVQWPDQDRGSWPDQRVHPQPHLRGGRPCGTMEESAPRWQPGGQEPPGDLRRADAASGTCITAMGRGIRWIGQQFLHLEPALGDYHAIDGKVFGFMVRFQLKPVQQQGLQHGPHLVARGALRQLGDNVKPFGCRHSGGGTSAFRIASFVIS